MAIAFVAAATGDSGGASTTVTSNITSLGSDRFAFIESRSNSNTNDLSSVTYDGAPASLLGTYSISANDRVWVHDVINPSTTTNAAVISTWSSSHVVNNRVTVYSGAKQTGQPEAQGVGTVSGATTITASVVTVSANAWHLAAMRNDQGGFTITGGTDRIAGGNALIIADNGPIIPTGATSIVGTWSGSGGGGYLSIAIAEATAATSTRDARYLTLIGVG